MGLLRILLNGLIMAAEVAAAIGVAWLGYSYPFAFAALTAALSLAVGLHLEIARLKNELPFYFEKPSVWRAYLVPVVGFSEALFKAALAGVAAVFTFAGTDAGRLYWVACLFAMTVFAGSSVLRFLAIRSAARPSRWGYFRLAPPLGLMFSAGVAALAALTLIKSSSLSDIGWKMIWEVPARPSVEQASELVFQIKQTFDDFVVTLLGAVLPPDWARAVGVVISVNMLTGFVAALYAALIASAVRWAEARLP